MHKQNLHVNCFVFKALLPLGSTYNIHTLAEIIIFSVGQWKLGHRFFTLFKTDAILRKKLLTATCSDAFQSEFQSSEL